MKKNVYGGQKLSTSDWSPRAGGRLDHSFEAAGYPCIRGANVHYACSGNSSVSGPRSSLFMFRRS